VNSVNCQIPGRAQSLGPFVSFAVRDTGKQMPVQFVKTGLLSHSLKLSASFRHPFISCNGQQPLKLIQLTKKHDLHTEEVMRGSVLPEVLHECFVQFSFLTRNSLEVNVFI
jgi:hypothetical protein